MSRKRTGLRNKYRSGKSTYSKRNKRAVADQYGRYVNGIQQSPERIAR